MSNQDSPVQSKNADRPVFAISAGFLLVFVVVFLLSPEVVSGFVNVAQNLSIKYFGALWQVLLLGTFVIALGLAFSKYGDVRVGGLEKPEISTSKWVGMIMTALLAGGGIFWSTAEPMCHFLSVPPAFPGIEGGTEAAVAPALAQSYLHWGFLAWAILGTLGTIIVMYACYEKKMPMKPRALLYPLLGEKGVNGVIGVLVDAFSIIAVAAGTIGPLGFLTLQLSYSLEYLIGIPDGFSSQLAVVAVFTVIFTLAASTGIYKGVGVLSRVNIMIAAGLMTVVMVFGPGGFIVDGFLTGFGLYVQDFFRISLFRGDSGWLGGWTIFYWGWFLAYAPMMAIFTARISRGRTIREIMLASAIIAPIVTNIWFTVLGGAGIYFELSTKGAISSVINVSGLQAALLTIVEKLPFPMILIPVSLILLVLFMVTCGAGMTYSMAISCTGDENPPIWVRVFWGALMGAVSAVLIKIGGGGSGIDALKAFIIITAVPISLVYIPTLWLGPRCAHFLAEKAGQRQAASLKNPEEGFSAGK